MGGQLLDVEDDEAVRLEHATRSEEREVGEMLVVDRVELELVDEVLQVRELDGEHPVRLQHPSQALDEVVQPGNVAEDVVGDDEVGVGVLTQLSGRGGAEEPGQRGDPTLDCDRGDIGGGLDAEDRDAAAIEVLEQVAVVARNLKDPASLAEPEPLRDLVREPLRVLEPGARVRREVRIVAEDRLGGLELLELHEEARFADQRPQWKEGLHPPTVPRPRVRVRERGHPEVGEHLPKRGFAEPAGRRAQVGVRLSAGRRRPRTRATSPRSPALP